MAKIINTLINRYISKSVKNAPSFSGPSSAFNRDPKATQVKRVGYQLSSEGGNGGGRENFESPPADFEVIDNAIQADSYINQAVMKYSELIFKSGWTFQGKAEQALDYIKLRLDTMAVATQIPTNELFLGIANDIVRYSNSFLVKARAKQGRGLPPGISLTPVPPARDPVAGYFRLPPQTIEIARDENGNVVKYRQESPGGGDPIEFNPEDIVHICVNRPVGHAFGHPWLAPVLDDVRLLRKVEENVSLLLYRHIFPLIAYQVGIDKPGYEATDEEIEEVQAIIENMPIDGTFVIPERHSIDAVKIDSIDAKPYLEYFENRVFSGLGMSQVDMGRGDTANRSTADAMTGIKADRVKGWQQQLQIQIDKYIIDELLVEGGFDPLINPEFDVNFVFNEIEQEMRIKTETHEIFKFEHNLQTFEETRKNMGMDPGVDESRLHFNMIGKAEKQAETDNKQKPENQHGVRTGPKRQTESTSDFHGRRVTEDGYNQLLTSFVKLYEAAEKNVVHEVARQRGAPLFTKSKGLSVLHDLREEMLEESKKKIDEYIETGVKRAMREMERASPEIEDVDSLKQVVESYVMESLDGFILSLEHALNDRLSDIRDAHQAYIVVRSVFQTMRHRLKPIARVSVVKAENYAFVSGLLSNSAEDVEIQYLDESCCACHKEVKIPFQLHKFKNVDEHTLFFELPPRHGNCKCQLILHKGGENHELHNK